MDNDFADKITGGANACIAVDNYARMKVMCFVGFHCLIKIINSMLIMRIKKPNKNFS